MIVREIGALPAILDRLLQVDRIASLPPLTPFGEEHADAPGPRGTTSATPSPTQAPAPPGLAQADAPAKAALVAALPLGRSITARVIDVPAADHVVAEVGDLRIALAWPAASGIAPQPGQDVILRVLALQPMLLFQRVDGQRADAPGIVDQNVHWSSDALRLQATAPTVSASQVGSGVVRFDVPVLAIEIEPLSVADLVDAHDSHPPSGVAGASDRAGSSAAPPVDPPTTARTASSVGPGAHDIAVDDVIVGHSTTLMSLEAPRNPHLPDNTVPTALPFAPLVLQGPAWEGQPMELVVRRERDDELFDNPVLDHWCGEVTIDLPHLGRVAGHLSFSMQGLRVRIEGDDEHSVTTMSAASSELAAALAHADLRVSGLTVAGRSADMTRSDWGSGVDAGYGGLHG